jgi:predicted glycosyltransferase
MLELHNKLKELKSHSHAHKHLNNVRDKTILDNMDWQREVDLILLTQYQSNQANHGNQANQTNQENQADMCTSQN